SSAAQHSKSLEAWFTHVPGLKVVMPATPSDGYWLLLDAIADDNPVIFIEPNRFYRERAELDTSRRPENVGEPQILRSGDHATIATWGMTTLMTLRAADTLSQNYGIDVEVIAF